MAGPYTSVGISVAAQLAAAVTFDKQTLGDPLKKEYCLWFFGPK